MNQMPKGIARSRRRRAARGGGRQGAQRPAGVRVSGPHRRGEEVGSAETGCTAHSQLGLAIKGLLLADPGV
jgi:hypothetical protein